MSENSPRLELQATPEEYERIFGVKNLETASTPEEFVRALDFSALNSILETLERRSGKETVSKPFVAEDIEFVDTTDTNETDGRSELEASADPDTLKIQLPWGALARQAKELNLEPVGIFVLHTLVHEAVHLRSRIVNERLVTEDNIWHIFGYSQLKENRKRGSVHQRFYVSLNEAVTEEIANEVLSEYLRRTGDRKLLLPELGEISYIADRLLLQAVIDALADSISVSRDTVWQGFVKGYVTGEEDIARLIAQISHQLLDLHPEISDKARDLLKGRSITTHEGFEELLVALGTETVIAALSKATQSLDKQIVASALGIQQ